MYLIRRGWGGRQSYESYGIQFKVSECESEMRLIFFSLCTSTSRFIIYFVVFVVY